MKLELIASYFLKIWDDVQNPKLWAILSAIGLFITQYIFSQWAFAIGFFIIFICDTISGTFVAVRTRQFEGKIFREKLLDKCVAYFTIIISFSAGTKVTLQESHVNLIEYLNVPFYSLFIAVELKSIANTWYQYKKWTWLKELLQLFGRGKSNAPDNTITKHIDDEQTDS